MVSETIKNREKPAAIANGFLSMTCRVDRYAPSAGPKVKAMLKHTPTSAMVEPLWLSSLMSVAMAMASCTLPSLSPPTTRLARKVRKSVAATQSATLKMLPTMDHRRAVRLPYLSESVPIKGDATAWHSEKSDPSAPPSRTMS